YCAIEFGQRKMRLNRTGAVTPAISRNSSLTAATIFSSDSCSTAASSRPPRKQRATILPSGTRKENLVPTQVQATKRLRSLRGIRKPKPTGGVAKSAVLYPSATVIDEL